MTDAINASNVSISESQAPSITILVVVRTAEAANRARIIAWSRVRDDVGLTVIENGIKNQTENQTTALKIQLKTVNKN